MLVEILKVRRLELPPSSEHIEQDLNESLVSYLDACIINVLRGIEDTKASWN